MLGDPFFDGDDVKYNNNAWDVTGGYSSVGREEDEEGMTPLSFLGSQAIGAIQLQTLGKKSAEVNPSVDSLTMGVHRAQTNDNGTLFTKPYSSPSVLDSRPAPAVASPGGPSPALHGTGTSTILNALHSGRGPSTDAESSPTTPADARQQQSMGAESSDRNSSEPIGLYRYATMTVSHAQATISERFINSTRSVSEPVHDSHPTSAADTVDNVDSSSSSVLPELGAAFGRLSLVQNTTDTTVA